jgi:stage V sporulation protein AB
MMNILKYILLILLGFGAGNVIAGAVFAFIAIIGVVPRLAQKTRTEKYIRIYENAIITGGIVGTSSLMINYRIPLYAPVVVILCFLIGVFYGCLAVSLAEVLDVIPILTRRGGLKKGIKYFILAIAVGKLIGAILYYCVPGFYAN